MKKQLFEYCWSKPKNGSQFISARDLLHAICNSDQFPLNPINKQEKPEEKLMNETIEAVFAAIDATPKYTLQDGRLIFLDLPKKKIDAWENDEVMDE